MPDQSINSKIPTQLEQQLSLLEKSVVVGLAAKSYPLIKLPPLSRQASLTLAIGHYCQHLVLVETPGQDLKLILRDLKQLLVYQGDGRRPVRKITTQDLQAFLRWQETKRQTAYPVKWMARHISTLQQFFGYLVNQRIIFPNPATPLVYHPREIVQTNILTNTELDRAMASAQAIGQIRPRAELVFRLALATGLQRDECTNLALSDIDLTEPEEPVLIIRPTAEQRQWEQRTLRFPVEALTVLARYQEMYPDLIDKLFAVSANTLEQDLQRIGETAKIEGKLSFARLRWTRAVHDQKRGVSPAILRLKLAVSETDWPTILPQLKQLANKPEK